MTDPVQNPRQGRVQRGEIVEFRGPAGSRQAQRLHRCPCCGCRTLQQRGRLEMCPVCAWGDAGQDEHDADTVRGGPNGALSLRQARANYRRFGASAVDFAGRVRKPQPDEL
jgi:hypothetical protein